MPTLTIYVPNELYDKVKDSPSRIVRVALEKYFENKGMNFKASKIVVDD